MSCGECELGNTNQVQHFCVRMGCLSNRSLAVLSNKPIVRFEHLLLIGLWNLNSSRRAQGTAVDAHVCKHIFFFCVKSRFLLEGPKSVCEPALGFKRMPSLLKGSMCGKASRSGYPWLCFVQLSQCTVKNGRACFPFEICLAS